MSSEYEKNVARLIQEKIEKLGDLRRPGTQRDSEIGRLVSEINTLETLFENYNLGMNYFRRAQGGRSRLRE
jgi:hypothetical protein